jgi:hypothetical protein
MEFAPGMGALKTFGRLIGGKAKDVGSGIMRTKIAQDLSAAPRGLWGDFRNMLGSFGQGFTPISSINANIQGAVSPAGGQAISSREQVPQAGQTYGLGLWSGIYDRLINEQGMTDAQAKQRMREMWQSGGAQTFGPIPSEFSLDVQEASLPSQGVIGGINQPVGQGTECPIRKSG